MGPNTIDDDSENTTQQLRDKIKKKVKRDNRPETFNVEIDKTYNQPLGRAMHRYPTRHIIQQVHKQQIIEERAQLYEPMTNENIPPFLLNDIIDDNTEEVDIKALIHGIEVIENKVNAITCPTTGKQLEYRHLIQDPATKAVWNPEMATEVDRLVSTRTTRFLKKKIYHKEKSTEYYSTGAQATDNRRNSPIGGTYER